MKSWRGVNLGFTIYHVVDIGENYLAEVERERRSSQPASFFPRLNKVSASRAHCGFPESHSCCTAGNNQDQC